MVFHFPLTYTFPSIMMKLLKYVSMLYVYIVIHNLYFLPFHIMNEESLKIDIEDTVSAANAVLSDKDVGEKELYNSLCGLLKLEERMSKVEGEYTIKRIDFEIRNPEVSDGKINRGMKDQFLVGNHRLVYCWKFLVSQVVSTTKYRLERIE